MRKRLNTEAIRNELEGSVFFPTPPKENQNQQQIQKPLPPHENTNEQQKATENITVRTPERSYARTPVRRQPTRYAFEFFQDQIEELRRISLEEKMLGGKGNMSEMVREAIDEYLARKKPTSE